jgi:acyl-CoA synthetase (AMP-forming)/AMP-acid ligase II
MIEAEPWSYHIDGSPVYSLADIIRKRSAITPQGIALTEAGRTTSFAELDQRSSQVARALQPGQTAEVMLPGGWLRTGDGGSFDADGFLYLHDRLKDMIVTGGENVYPAEVESVMTGHPAVAEVAVVGVPSAAWGESPYAVVVLRPGAQVSEAELISWTRDRLAHFKCPAGVSFAASLARTASGKLQKQAIRASLSSVAVR